MNKYEVIDFFEQQIRGMAKATSMREVVVGLHNACAHGEIFEHTGESVDEDQLEELFDHFDAILGILK